MRGDAHQRSSGVRRQRQVPVRQHERQRAAMASLPIWSAFLEGRVGLGEGLMIGCYHPA
jgi:hypothetical protein